MPGESLFELHKKWNDVDPAADLPVSLDAHRPPTDGLTHCTKCGGTHFTATVVLDAHGAPVHMFTPQKCIGCGELRKAHWQS